METHNQYCSRQSVSLQRDLRNRRKIPNVTILRWRKHFFDFVGTMVYPFAYVGTGDIKRNVQEEKFGTPIYGAYHSFSQNPKLKKGVMVTITMPVGILPVARKFSKTFFCVKNCGAVLIPNQLFMSLSVQRRSFCNALYAKP